MIQQKPLPVMIQEIKERQEKARTWKAFERDESLFGHKNLNQQRVNFFGFKEPVFTVREQPSPKDFDRVVRALEVRKVLQHDNYPCRGCHVCDYEERVRAILAGEDEK